MNHAVHHLRRNRFYLMAIQSRVCCALADLRWYQGRATPRGPNSFIFMQFSAKNLKNNSTFGSWHTGENPGSVTVVCILLCFIITINCFNSIWKRTVCGLSFVKTIKYVRVSRSNPRKQSHFTLIEPSFGAN